MPFARTFFPAALVAACFATLAGAVAGKEEFNLEARKQRQPWLWQKPQRQVVPTVSAAPGAGEVDRFLLAKLLAKGIRPAPAADDLTWLRRAHFAITGLPPRREELQAFLADTDSRRRERVVDSLLASPHFGERWARHWMDLMRYAESRGHEGDYIIANAWHYRDYLIRAFNADVPYDQFLLEHLAGDLLPHPRLRPGTDINESVVGTGWAFLGEENHSPVDIRQDECERIDNKVDVFSKTFLGLTVSCARCHDHKFDPIRAQDYYALSGFMLSSSFRQVRFEAMENNRKMAVELAGLRERAIPRLGRAVAEARAPGVGQIAEYLMAARKLVAGGPGDAGAAAGVLDTNRVQLWAQELRQAATNPWSLLHPLGRAALHPDALAAGQFAGLLASNRPVRPVGLPVEAKVLADYTRPGVQPWKVDGEAFGSRPARTGEVVPGAGSTNPIARVMTYGAARRDQFWKRLRTAPGNQNDSGRLAATARAGQMLCTPTATLGVGRLHYLIRGKAQVYAAVDSHLMIEGPLHGRLVQSFDSGPGTRPRWVTHDLSPYSGHRVHLEFGPDGGGDLDVLMVVESAEPPSWQPGVQFDPPGSIQSWADVAAALQTAAVAACARLQDGTLAASPEASLDAALADWEVQNPLLFGSSGWLQAPEVAGAAQELFNGEEKIASRVRWESRTAVSWFDGTGVDENILVRGKPFNPGTLSPRSLPAAFGTAKPTVSASSSGRYEMGLQLVDPANPLVARAIVNRVWHHLFGRGIVPTVDNFGMLGEPATHPELLDQLAWRFVHEEGWSLKSLIKRLVLTEAFARSSRSTDARAEELDPSNALLHRMPLRRLEGEVIRDALLTISGRLNPAVGGPPVQVYLTEFLVGRGRPDQSGPLDGDGRRSIYTAMHRNFLPTLMQTFDAPTPFSAVGRRNVTNVPGQSLALMNDPIFHQQAGVWAARLLKETPGADGAARVRWLFESGYGRRPTAAESGACLGSLAELARLHPSGTPAVESWTDLCHALLNANDFIYVK